MAISTQIHQSVLFSWRVEEREGEGAVVVGRERERGREGRVRQLKRERKEQRLVALQTSHATICRLLFGT